jgi:hypothetical protein
MLVLRRMRRIFLKSETPDHGYAKKLPLHWKIIIGLAIAPVLSLRWPTRLVRGSSRQPMQRRLGLSADVDKTND